MVDFAPEYYREAKFFYSEEYITEMFNRNSIPVRFFQIDKSQDSEHMDQVYLDESDPYIEELRGSVKEYQGEKYFGRDYTSVEMVHCVFTTEAARETQLTRYGYQVQDERLEAVVFLHDQVVPTRGDYFQVPLHQEYDELRKQPDGRVLPDDPLYILYIILEAKPDPTGKLFITVSKRVDKPKDQERIIE